MNDSTSMHRAGRQRSWRTAKGLAATLGALSLVAVTAGSAHAGTPSTTVGTTTLTASHASLSTNAGYTTVSSGTTVSGAAVSGAGYSGRAGATGTGSAVGVYVVYGPKESDFNTNSGWYHSFAYVPYASISGGSFSGVSLNLAKSYAATPFHDDPAITVDCAYDNDLTPVQNATAGKKKCYIQTFTAHGLPLNPADELGIEVRWP